MNHIFRFAAALALLSAVLFLAGCGKKPVLQGYEVTLEMWGVFDDSGAYKDILSSYTRDINPYVKKINYRKLAVEDYKKDLIDAMAAGQGPDIFMVHNTWLPQFANKIEPIPTNLMVEKEFRDNFVDVATEFINEERIYGLPLSVDSLALYYNKDIFNSTGIVYPPATWEEFIEVVKKTAKRDQFGRVERAGAALGTAENVNRSTDILGMLMLQNGTEMSDQKTGAALFNKVNLSEGRTKVNPGVNALEFYTQFAQVGSPVYTWNKDMHYSVDAFSGGEAAMMLNYSWQKDAILNKNGKLNFAVAPLPQRSFDNKANHANYWVYVVAKDGQKSANQKISNKTHEAWQFLKFLTVKNNGTVKLANALSGAELPPVNVDFDPALDYLAKTNKPAARRDIIELQKSDVFLGPFAEGNLVAKSWHQSDSEAIEKIFMEMIDDVNVGRRSATDALREAASRVTQVGKK